ncbi:response regulator [Candidatus Kaiserbacteria bacterium]|nr:response regulator [Candidatus Kaiserbacteria bacterium]
MRVLMADGDEVFLEVAQRYLSDRGHEVNIARNGLEAVASLRRGLPKVVVLERELLWGGSDGVRALMRKVPGWSEIPLILTSSDAMPDDSDSVAGPPVVARLQKPYRLKDLLEHLHACSLNGTPSLLSGVAQGGRP